MRLRSLSRILPTPLALGLLLIAGTAQADLVAHWKFDGNLLDSAGTNHGATGGLGLTTFVPGLKNQALSFPTFPNNMSQSWIAIPDDPSLDLATGEMTLAAFVNPVFGPFPTKPVFFKGALDDMQGEYDLLLGSTVPVANSFVARVNMNGIDVSTSQISAQTPTNVITHTGWQCVVATFDLDGSGDGRLRLYVDGTLEDTTIDPSVTSINASTDPLYIGTRFGIDSNTGYVGLMDDLRIYDHALTPAEVQSLCNRDDADGDMCLDVDDNCPQLATTAKCDTDDDGFGNPCDGDFDQNSIVNGLDFSASGAFNDFLDCFVTGTDPNNIGCDMNCDTVINSADFSPWFLMQFAQGFPGP